MSVTHRFEMTTCLLVRTASVIESPEPMVLATTCIIDNSSRGLARPVLERLTFSLYRLVAITTSASRTIFLIPLSSSRSYICDLLLKTCTAMSVSRVFLQSRCLFSRGCTTACATRTMLPFTGHVISRRQFALSTRLWRETIETPSRGPEVPLTATTSGPSESHARSIAVLRLEKRATRSEIEELFSSKGLHMYVR
jgi:hypothetical protein